MTAPELKPCPFCGASASYNVTSDEGQQNDYDTVGCSACPAEMRIILHWADDAGKNKADLLSAWNRRTDLAQPAQVLETCGKCMGSGYGGHPDSGHLCAGCNGSGGVEPRPHCTCHPDDNPPKPCPQKYALTECRNAVNKPQPDPRDEVIARLVEAATPFADESLYADKHHDFVTVKRSDCDAIRAALELQPISKSADLHDPRDEVIKGLVDAATDAAEAIDMAYGSDDDESPHRHSAKLRAALAAAKAVQHG